MIEGNTDMTNDEIKETIQKAFNKWEIRACRSMRQDIDDNTMLITLLDKYHEHDETETDLMHQEKRDKKEKEIYKKASRALRKTLTNSTQTTELVKEAINVKDLQIGQETSTLTEQEI